MKTPLYPIAMSLSPVLTPICLEDASAISAMAEKIWPKVYSNLISSDQMRFMLDWMYARAELIRQMEEKIEYILMRHPLTGSISHRASQ